MSRTLREIADDVLDDWLRISPYALPYLKAMAQLDKISDMYGADDGKTVVLYFLENAKGWRGPIARAIKAELREMVK